MWPIKRSPIVESEFLELRKIAAVAVRITIVNPVVELLCKFSNLNKVCRIVAYYLRFLRMHYRTTGKTNINVSHDEISNALNILCKFVQRDTVSNEIDQLEKRIPLNSSSSLISLSPFLDDFGAVSPSGGMIKEFTVVLQWLPSYSTTKKSSTYATYHPTGAYT